MTIKEELGPILKNKIVMLKEYDLLKQALQIGEVNRQNQVQCFKAIAQFLEYYGGPCQAVRGLLKDGYPAEELVPVLERLEDTCTEVFEVIKNEIKEIKGVLHERD